MRGKYFTYFAIVVLGTIGRSAEQILPAKADQLNAGLLQSVLNDNAPVTLTRIPTRFFTNLDSSESGNIVIEWQESSVQLGDFYFSRFPNVASGQFPRRIIPDTTPGDRKIVLNAGLDSLTTGIYYCIIVDAADPDSTSIEFNMVIEHHLSPGNFQPDTTTSGFLSWDPSHANTPFYHVIVSNRPVRLDNIDQDPDNEVIGINVIYQAITSNTFITYRESDPSGFFDNSKTPRLASGNTYYWMVFNNYGNNHALSSQLVTFAEVPRFVYSDPASEQPPPINRYPVDTLVTNIDTLTFSWSGVGNSSYHFYLYEETEQSGNVGSYLIFDTTIVTGDTSFTLPAADQLLVSTNYYWNVAAENGPFYSESTVDSFRYENTGSGILEVHTQTDAPGNPPLARVNLRIINLNGPSSNITYLTNESGNFDRPLSESSYRILAGKEGFSTLDTVVNIIRSQTTRLDLSLQSNPTFFSGRIQIPGNSVIPGVKLVSETTGNTYSVLGELRLSDPQTSEYTFRANVSPDTWTIYPFADGFKAVIGDTISRSITFGEYVELPVLDLETLPARITVNVTDDNNTGLHDVWLTFEKGLQQHTVFVTDFPFSFTVDPGSWTVRAEKQGYFSQAQQYQVEVADQQDVQLDVIMVRAGNLRGTTFSATGFPLPGVAVSAEPQDASGRAAQTNSNDAGVYGPLLLKPGTYRITAFKTDYSPAETTLTVTPYDSILYNPVLKENRSYVRGMIRNQFGAAVEGAIVHYIFGFSGGFSLPSDSEGNYILRVPSDVAISVFATRDGYATSDTVTLTVPENIIQQQDFVLFRLTSVISGIVKTLGAQNFDPLPGVAVSAVDTVSGQLIYRDSTDAAGHFKVYVDAGIFRILAEKEYYLKADRIVNVGSGDSLDIEFVLIKNYGTLHGKVLNGQGLPVSNVNIEARHTSSGLLSATVTDSAGKYSLTGLEPGENYNISATLLRHFIDPPEGYDCTVQGGDTSGFDFTVTRAIITDLQIVNTVKKLPNNHPTRFFYKAWQDDREITIDPPLWTISYPDSFIYKTANFSVVENGKLFPAIDALDAGITIIVTDTARDGGLSARLEDISIYAPLTRNDFFINPFRLRDHSGMVLEIDSSAIDAASGLEGIHLSRLPVAESKRVSAGTESFGDSYKLTGIDNLLKHIRLTLPVSDEAANIKITESSRNLNIGRWDDSQLTWEILPYSSISTFPYNSVSHTINSGGEYIVLVSSRPLGIRDLRILPNPFSPNLINRNDPFKRGLPGQIIRFTLTSLDLRRPFVTAQIFNINGELVRDLVLNEPQTKGTVALIWDGKTNSGSFARNGRYILRLRVQDFSGEKEELKTTVLIK